MLSLDYIKFKNFLSFGNRLQEIPILNGVNIVLGHDKDKDKSNGAGKSSFLETIPFALYGQIHKDVKQEDIINWKNRKDCYVELGFSKGDKRYIVKRGMKPKVFDIYENDILLDKPAHSKDYQVILENIIGLNFQTFMSLVHTNINSSTPVLAMSKPDKRKFIEKIFGLELYGLLNELSNTKLKCLNDNIREFSIKIDSNAVRYNEITSTIKSLELKVNQNSRTSIELTEKEETLNSLKEKFENGKEELYDIKEDLLVKESDIARINLIMNNIKNKNINTINYKILPPINSRYKILLESKKQYDDLKDQILELEKLKTEYESSSNVNILISNKIGEVSKNEEERISLKDKWMSIEHIIINLNKDINSINSKITSLQKDAVCPTCGQKIKDVPVEQIEILKNEIEEKKNAIPSVERELINLKKQVKDSEDFIDDLKNERDKLRNVYRFMLNIENKLSNVVEIKESDLELLVKKQSKYDRVIKRLNVISDKLNSNKLTKIKSMNLLEERKSIIESEIKKMDDIRNDIKFLKEKIKLEEDNKKEMVELLDKQKAILGTIETDNKNYKSMIDAKTKMIDYLDAIKWVCKDENIKKFAISYKMPYLNGRVNHYLSEVGYGFYAIIDKWLDTIIKAPGIPNGSYGSLSGGEARGIDLALQFAIHDIARLQSGIWPDTIVMDEVLDSSIDGRGIEKIMGIIKAKQIEQNNKIFIISHREEMDQFEPDNIYFVEKSDGYSKVVVK